jgi:acyl-CoA oxidase
MDAMGIINYVYENAKTAISRTDCNQKTDESHLIDQDFHLPFFNTEKKQL